MASSLCYNGSYRQCFKSETALLRICFTSVAKNVYEWEKSKFLKLTNCPCYPILQQNPKCGLYGPQSVEQLWGQRHRKHCRDCNAPCKWPFPFATGAILGPDSNTRVSCMLQSLFRMAPMASGILRGTKQQGSSQNVIQERQNIFFCHQKGEGLLKNHEGNTTRPISCKYGQFRWFPRAQ